MKKFFFKLVLFFVVLIILLSLFYIRIIHNQNKAEKNHYLFAQLDKQKLLNDTITNNNQRIIFIGGSSLAFGLDSLKIESTLNKIFDSHFIVINTGLHAGIGINRMIENILPYLRKQDMLILVPEYDTLSNQVASGNETAWHLEFDVLKKTWAQLQKKDYLHYPTGLAAYIKTKILHKLREAENSTSAYRRNGFNIRGDNIAHLSKKNAKNIEPFLSQKPYSTSNTSNFLHYIQLLKQKNVRIIFNYPCYQKRSYIIGKTMLHTNDIFLRNHLPVNFIGCIDRYVFDDRFLYDTVYHLNAEGRQMRTNLVIEDLIEYLKNQGYTHNEKC